MPSSSGSQRWWHRLPRRLSLRVFMLLIVIICCGLGWMENRAQVQRDAVAEIDRIGGSCFYEWQVAPRTSTSYGSIQLTRNGRPSYPKWLGARLGPEYLEDIKAVIVHANAPDSIMPAVGRLHGLEALRLVGSQVSDAGLVHLRDSTQLKEFSAGTLYADTGAGPVPFYPTRITGAGLNHLKSLSRLERLYLSDVPIADSDLSFLSGLDVLEELILDRTGITDAAFPYLEKLKSLRFLSIDGTRVTNEGIAAFRRKRPLVKGLHR